GRSYRSCRRSPCGSGRHDDRERSAARLRGTATRHVAGMVWPPILRWSCETARMEQSARNPSPADPAAAASAVAGANATTPGEDASPLADRLAAAGAELKSLRPRLEAGEPWPLSAAY